MDAVQEVMRTLARALRSFEYDPARGTFRSWLYTVTRREVGRLLKRNARQPLSGGSAYVAILDNTPNESEERDWDLDYRLQLFEWACERARPDFNSQHWRAFTMTALEERPAEEVAAALETTVAAVYVAKSRIVHRIRTLIHSVAAESWEIDAARDDPR
jgi:RNA polymerase sigma-70 factor (ECF subfamily)